jgi:hypothetical protein
MVTVANRNRTLKVRKSFGERIFRPSTDRLSEARRRSQFLTFPFASLSGMNTDYATYPPPHKL